MRHPDSRWHPFVKGIIFLGVLALLPFLVLTAYNHPAADDFGFALRDGQASFWEIQRETYQQWSGRYFGTAILQINPLLQGSVVLYKWYSLLLILFFVGTVYALVQQLYRQSLSRKERIGLVALSLCTFFTQYPDITQAFFWLTGYLGYQLPQIFLLLLLLCLIQLFKAKIRWQKMSYTLLASVLAVAVAGSNEMAMIMLVTTVSFISWQAWGMHTTTRPYLILVLAVTLIACVVAVAAPGNYMRMQEHAQAQRPLWSLLYTSVLTLASIYKWAAPLLVATLVYAFFFYSTSSHSAKSPFFEVNFKKALLFYLVTLFLQHLAFVWATGERPTPRVENSIYFFSVIGWFYLLQVALAQYGTKLQEMRLAAPKAIAFVLFALLFLQVYSMEGPVMTAYLDLLTGKASQYDQEMKARYKKLESTACSSCPLPNLSAVPNTLHFKDITVKGDTVEWWVNEGVAGYWQKEEVYLTNPNPPAEDNVTSLRNWAKAKMAGRP